MKRNFSEMPNGYLETISRGISAVRRFRDGMTPGDLSRAEAVERLKREIETADAVVTGAGAGLSTSAGFIYTGERFDRYFSDFAEKYHFTDMYSGGFYVLKCPPEEMWAYWSRYIWINRYAPIPNDTYDRLYEVVKDKDYFVITTNVDHCFQRSGFDKTRLFYTQGDYGLLQSARPRGASAHRTYDNEEIMRKMILAQGFGIGEDNGLIIPEGRRITMRIPAELIPYCPDDGEQMTTNLRADDSFVEDEGWHKASAAYLDFLEKHEGQHVLFLEIGVGMNTPVIIKYPFWQMTDENPNAVYACLNYNEAYCPVQIEKRSICISGDSGEVIRLLSPEITKTSGGTSHFPSDTE